MHTARKQEPMAKRIRYARLAPLAQRQKKDEGYLEGASSVQLSAA